MFPSRSVLESGTTVYNNSTGYANCFAITCVTDVTFTTLTGLSGDTVAGVTFPAGLTIYGNFSAVTLATGTALLYFSV